MVEGAGQAAQESGAGHDGWFEFETVTVDTQGRITQREQARAQQMVERIVARPRRSLLVGRRASGVTPDAVPLELVLVPGGSFLMGSRTGQGCDDERPLHSVFVPSIWLGKFAVTQEQWAAVMPWQPRYRCVGPRRPVDRVSWNEAQEFCHGLAKLTGRDYRLPSEAEWEYACRAGTSTPFSCGETITTDLANYVGEHVYREEPKGIYRHGTTDTGAFAPNAFGVYDMHGNVWEWCADAWHDDHEGAPRDGAARVGPSGSARVLRGGCWHDTPHLLRSAARLKSEPGEREDFFGFRVALNVTDLGGSR